MGLPPPSNQAEREVHLRLNTFVLGLVIKGQAVAYPFDLLREQPIIHDQFEGSRAPGQPFEHADQIPALSCRCLPAEVAPEKKTMREAVAKRAARVEPSVGSWQSWIFSFGCGPVPPG